MPAPYQHLADPPAGVAGRWWKVEESSAQPRPAPPPRLRRLFSVVETACKTVPAVWSCSFSHIRWLSGTDANAASMRVWGGTMVTAGYRDNSTQTLVWEKQRSQGHSR